MDLKREKKTPVATDLETLADCSYLHFTAASFLINDIPYRARERELLSIDSCP